MGRRSRSTTQMARSRSHCALALTIAVVSSCASAAPPSLMSVSYSTSTGVTLAMDGVTLATGMPSLVNVCPDKSSTRTFMVDTNHTGATFSATSPVGSYTIKYSGGGPALPTSGVNMTLSFTSNASAMTKPQDLWFLPLASGGWCYHVQQDGKWAPDTTGPWSFPHYGESTPGGQLDLGYPLPGGKGTPGLEPGPQVHFAEWEESSIVSVLPDNPPNTSWGWFSWGPYKWRSMLVLAAVEPGESRTVNFALRAGPGNSSSVSPASVAQDAYNNYGKRYPLQHRWPDRRPMAMVMTAIHGIDAYNRTTNPHSYDTGQPKPFDMTTAEGRSYFKKSLIEFAHEIVAVDKQRGEYAKIQGVIVSALEFIGNESAHTPHLTLNRLIAHVGVRDRFGTSRGRGTLGQPTMAARTCSRALLPRWMRSLTNSWPCSTMLGCALASVFGHSSSLAYRITIRRTRSQSHGSRLTWNVQTTRRTMKPSLSYWPKKFHMPTSAGTRHSSTPIRP